jgi:N-acetyltransferase
MQVQATVLEGQRVRLEPLEARHLSELREAIEDGELWRIPVTFVPHPRDLPQFLEEAERAYEAGRELAFATIDLQSGRVVGSTRFMEIDATHKRLEIGFTFVAATYQRTHVNSEAKYLMLRHAFGPWGCQRVTLVTDVLNDKSRRAIERIGAKQEGIMRSHMVMRDGRVRDSVLFSIIANEWPAVERALAERLVELV